MNGSCKGRQDVLCEQVYGWMRAALASRMTLSRRTVYALMAPLNHNQQRNSLGLLTTDMLLILTEESSFYYVLPGR